MRRFLPYFITIIFGIVTSLALWQLIFMINKPASFVARSVLGLVSEKINFTKTNNQLLQGNLIFDLDHKIYPLVVPSSGIAGHKNFLYNPPFHGGIDIWTNIKGRGVDGKGSRGNPVYAACSGTVIRVYHPNEEIEIKCDKLDSSFKDMVPSLEIKILYAHMGDAVTHEPYHKLRVGQRLIQGEFVGYQGNVSSIMPVNRVTHLHFGVYDLSKRKISLLDPAPYIGVPTNKAGQIFVAAQNND